jgi:hypothetical protein
MEIGEVGASLTANDGGDEVDKRQAPSYSRLHEGKMGRLGAGTWAWQWRMCVIVRVDAQQR